MPPKQSLLTDAPLNAGIYLSQLLPVWKGGSSGPSSWEWVTVTKAFPLTTAAVGPHSSPDDKVGTYNRRSAALKLQLSTGVLEVQLSSELDTVEQLNRKRWSWIKLVLTVLVTVAVCGLVYFLLTWKSRAIHRKNIQWIEDFYRVHAPEVGLTSYLCLLRPLPPRSVLSSIIRPPYLRP